MTPAQVTALSAVLLRNAVGYTAVPNKDKIGDWIVTCTPGVAVDVSQIAAIESQLGITSPVTGVVTFV